MSTIDKLRVLAFAVLACMLLQYPAIARSTPGLRVGCNAGAMLGDDVSQPSASPKVGLTFGGFMRMPVFNNAEMQVELALSVKGIKREFSATIPYGFLAFSANEKLTYLEVPILLRFPFTVEEGAPKLAVLFGPYGAIAINSRASGSYQVTGSARINDGTYTGAISNLHRLDFGLVFGGEAQLPVGGRMKPAIEIRYTMGLTNLYEDALPVVVPVEDDIAIVDARTYEDLSMRNSVLSASLVLQLPW